MQFDLGVVDTRKRSEEGVELAILGADGLPIQIRGETLAVVLAGPDSERFAEGQRKAQKRSLEATEKRQEMPDGEFFSIVLAHCAISWTGVFAPGDKGKAIACSPEAATELFKQYPWIREQARNFAGQRVNFLPPSSPK